MTEDREDIEGKLLADFEPPDEPLDEPDPPQAESIETTRIK
jgi:hypothetical protein